MTKSLLMAGAVLALVSTAPALAQSLDPDYGTGNTFALSADNVLAYSPAHMRANRLRGIRADAEAQIGNRAVTGSVGYNEKLLHD